MGSLAVELARAGVVVSGCDRAQVYDPIRSQLLGADISFAESWDLSHLKTFGPDLVVIGNVCTAKNPCVEWVTSRKIPHEHLASLVSKIAQELQTGKRLVVAGTHGKTSTAFLMRHLCQTAHLRTASFIGGVDADGHSGVTLVDAPDVFVVEGDEYDCAYFDKQPKFMYYGGDIAVLNACEMDHVDIYPSLDDMIRAYQKWLQVLAPSGDLWVNLLVKESAIWREALSKTLRPDTRLHVFGQAGKGSVKAEWSYQSKSPGHVAVFHALQKVAEHQDLVIPNSGFCQSVTAAYGIGVSLGIPLATISQAVNTFCGVARRFRVVRDRDFTVIDDFAHHPTAIQMNLDALRGLYPGRRLGMIFEPRSATSRRNVLYSQWLAAFKRSDVCGILPIFKGSAVSDPDPLRVEGLLEELSRVGIHALRGKSWEEFGDKLRGTVKPGDVWVIFSNGDTTELVKWFQAVTPSDL
jgi:UDP-N-acetylmuramate: L-alanyl-gamma-D-glutamyl-meso-diaminopimelate ligase